MEKPITILAVDDNQDILFTLIAIGKNYGWNVVPQNDSRLVAGQLQKVQPDLILMDYHMPGMDGLTVVQSIRRQNRSIPIIILTVDERQEIADRFLDAGANDFANKPIKVADLAARIKVHLNIRQQQESLFREKGINTGTLELVATCCQSFQQPFLAEEVVERTGLAYQTVVRYLQHLQDLKTLKASSHYGKVGRPKKLFKNVQTRTPE